MQPYIWSYVVDKCGDGGHFYTTGGGMITSPSYPGNYPDYSDCIYTISQPTGRVIRLNFLTMDINNYMDRHCDNDYLEIRDGPSADSPTLAKLCGSDIPSPMESSMNQLWMK